MYSVSSQKILWGWASAIWQLDSLFDTVRIVCGARSIKRSGVRLSVSQSVPSVKRSSGVRRVCCWTPYAQTISIDSARQPQPGAAARRSTANAGNVMLTAELTRLNTQTWVTLYFRPIKILAVFTACVEFVSGWEHARNYISTHWADWTWMDGRTKFFPYFVLENLATVL